MSIAQAVKASMTNKNAGVIRKMFEEGIKLKAQYGNDRVFDYSLGNPDLEPPAEVLEAVKEEALNTEKNVHGYMPNAGYPFCRKAMADKTSLEQGVSVSQDCVVMSVGAAGALNSVFKAIINPGDEVIVPAPFFAEYRHYASNFGGKLVEVPSKKDFSPDIEAIKATLNEKTAAVLINSPNNPTGRVYSEEDIKALADALKAHAEKSGRAPYLVLDEPYRAIVYDGKKVPSAFPLYDSSIVVTSFAKNLSLPGERIGYVCVNPACPDRDEVVQAVTFATRILGYVNAPAFFQRVITKSWNAECDYSLYEKRRNMLMEALDAAGIEHVVPEGAFYMWCKVPESFGDDDMAFTDYLKKYLILAAPGSGFGGKGWFRLSYCVSEDCIKNSREAFIKAMEELK
ncbi:MAG: pyridoxal phosphate-dependent aminotransferase [Treponema sp.]|nr:pyridoxal phosphate-dependent aminotransferase [Treponema sp.]